MIWFLSFAADEGPFLGFCVVEAPSMIEAARVAHRLKINPGGSVLGAGCEKAECPKFFMNKLFQDKELGNALLLVLDVQEAE